MPSNDNTLEAGKVIASSGPPKGYSSLGNSVVPPELHQIATGFLKYPFGTLIPFTIDNVSYIGRIEQHYRAPSKHERGVQGAHKGCSIFVKSNKQSINSPIQNTEQQTQILSNVDQDNEETISPRLSLLQKLDNFLSNIG